MVVYIVASVLLVSQNINAMDMWYGKGAIKSVQTEIYRRSEVAINLTFTETDIVSEDCANNSTWVLKSDLDTDGRIYAVLLTAVTSGKKVNLRQNGCYVISNESYPLMGGVKNFN